MALQQPTLRNARCRTFNEALLVFHAVWLQKKPIIHRRLSAPERLQIRPGDVYVWEERAQHAVEQAGLAIERWTDCFSWGPSRVRDEFLYYTQKEREFRRTNNRRNDTPPQEPGERWHKQTVSVLVRNPDEPTTPPRKWHMTAYFYQENLPDVSAALKDIPPPPQGMFTRDKSPRVRRNGATRPGRASSEDTAIEDTASSQGSRARTMADPYPRSSIRLQSPARSVPSPSVSAHHPSLPSLSETPSSPRTTSSSAGSFTSERPSLPSIAHIPHHAEASSFRHATSQQSSIDSEFHPFGRYDGSSRSTPAASTSSSKLSSDKLPRLAQLQHTPRQPEFISRLPDPLRPLLPHRFAIIGTGGAPVFSRRREDDEALRKFT